MATHVFMVATQPPAGEEEAFGRWHVEHHMPQVLAVPGFVSGQRYRLAPNPAEPDAPETYLALFELETDDVDAALGELARRVREGEMPLYPGASASMVMRHVGTAVSPRLQSPAPNPLAK